MYAVYMPNMCSKVTGIYAVCMQHVCCMYAACQLCSMYVWSMYAVCMLYTCLISRSHVCMQRVYIVSNTQKPKKVNINS